MFDEDTWLPDTTTIMVRHLPASYTAEDLLVEVVKQGFESTFDFFYLPMDFKSRNNMGYAFINFKEPETCKCFARKIHGQKLSVNDSDKTLEVVRADRQGFEANLDRAKKEKHRVKNPWYRPLIFK